MAQLNTPANPAVGETWFVGLPVEGAHLQKCQIHYMSDMVATLSFHHNGAQYNRYTYALKDLVFYEETSA